MKFFAALAMVLLATGLLSAQAQQSADDQYLILLGSIQQADALAGSGQLQPALGKYVEVQGALEKFQKIFPDWQPAIIKYRLQYLAGKIGGLTAQVPAVSPAAAVAGASPLSPAEAELASLRGQVQNLQSDNTLLTAKLKEALAAQPAMVDAGELAKAQAQIQSLAKENALLKSSPATVAPVAVTVTDTNALARAQMQIQALTQENELLKTNLAREKMDATNALASSSATLAQAQAQNQSLTQSNVWLAASLSMTKKDADDFTAAHAEDGDKFNKLTSDNSKLQTGLLALQDENAQLKTQLADLKASAPADSGAAAKLDADLKSAKLQVITLQSDAQAKQLGMAALEKRIEELKTATNAVALAPPADDQAANLASIRALTQERDDLLGKLGEANKRLYGSKKTDAIAQIDDLTDQITALRARLAVDEAQPVPYTPEELALLKQTAPLLADRNVEKKSIARLPAGSAELVAAAEAYFSAKQFDKAEANYLQILAKDEKNPLVLANLAAIELQLGKLDEAERHVKAALAQNPDDAYNLATLGYLKFRQEKYDEALDALSRAAKLDPQNPEIENYLGVTLSHKGLRTPAEAALRKAIQLDPNYAAAHNNLAAIYISQTPPLAELARWHYQKALAAGQPRNPDLEKALGLNAAGPANPP